MRKLILSLAAIATLASCSETKTQEQGKLELNLTKGETYPQIMTVNSTIDQEMMGQKIQMVMNMNASIDYTVSDVQNDVYVLNTTYTDMAVDMSVAGQNMNFSSKDTTNPAGKFISSMVGKSFTIHMKKDGSVEKIEGLDNIINGMLANAGDSMSQMEQQQLMMQIKQSWGEKALTENLKLSSGMYPKDGNAKVGDTWNQTMNIPTAFDLNVNIDYTLADASADVYTVTGKGSIDIKKDTVLRGADANINLNGDMDFKYKIDAKTGWVTNASGTQHFGGEIKVKAGDQEMVMPMNVQSNINISSTK